MQDKIPNVSRRVIGKVNIFDIVGSVDTVSCEGIQNYILSYLKEFNLNNVIMNIQSVEKSDEKCSETLIEIMSIPKKSALYADCNDVVMDFTDGCDTSKTNICHDEMSILNIFGKELIEKDKLIQFTEQRNSVRLKTALAAALNFVDKNGNIIKSSAIVTNLSKNGLFAEYLDIKSKFTIESLDYFKNLIVEVEMFSPDDVDKKIMKIGHILRIEFSGHQAGIAIEFK